MVSPLFTGPVRPCGVRSLEKAQVLLQTPPMVRKCLSGRRVLLPGGEAVCPPGRGCHGSQEGPECSPHPPPRGPTPNASSHKGGDVQPPVLRDRASWGGAQGLGGEVSGRCLPSGPESPLRKHFVPQAIRPPPCGHFALQLCLESGATGCPGGKWKSVNGQGSSRHQRGSSFEKSHQGFS